MALEDQLIAASDAVLAPLVWQEDGSLALEAVVAVRGTLLKKKRLEYRCGVRIDDDTETVWFWETLVEKGAGLPTAGRRGVSAGFGLRQESCTSGLDEDEGRVEQVARLFDKDGDLRWDSAALRASLRQVVELHGYRFETQPAPVVLPVAQPGRFAIATGSISSAGVKPNTAP
jgi:hypothetical protein